MEVKELITRAMMAKENLDVLSLALTDARVNHKHGLQDILSKRVYLAKAKLKDYVTRLFRMGQGTIIKIYFLEYGEKGIYVPQGSIRYYNNITKEEATTLLNFWASYNSLKIKILEIEEISTSKTYNKL